MKKIMTTVCVLALLIFAFNGCESSASNSNVSDKEKATEAVNVRMAYFPNITHAQALVMKANHTLEDALGSDCNVSWTSFNAGSSEVEAFFADAIDIGYIGPVPAINGNVKSNGNLTVISNAADAGAVLLKRKDSGISSIADLDGKIVVIPQIGNTQYLCLLNLLEENDLKPISEGGTVKVVAVENSNVQNMFDQGHIDAALVPEPWGTILTARDDVEILADYDELYLNGNYPVTAVVVRNEFLEEYPDIVEKFLQVHMDTTEVFNSHLEDSVSDIVSEIAATTGNTLDKNVVLKSFSKTNITTELNEEALRAFAQTSYDKGFIDQLPGDDLIDMSILDKLTK